jgi:cell division protein FtsN
MIKLEYATWYRVKLGPYRTLSDADRIRLYLRDQHIDSIIQTPVE